MKKVLFYAAVMAGAISISSCVSKKDLVNCQKENVELNAQYQNTREQLAAANAQIASLEENAGATQLAAPAPVVAPAPAPAVDLSVSERQISQVLIVAQQSADKLVAEARDNAERIRNEADQKAREVIRQALAEKQNELDEIDRLKQSREDFRGEYKKLLQHFMDDAEAVMPAAGFVALSAPNGSAGTTHNDAVAVPAPVAPAAPVAAPASDVSPLGDFGDLD